MEKKARTLTPRENIMRILNRQTPEWIPFTNDEVWYLHIDEVLERGPEKGGAGYDWFGVHWTYTKEADASTPTPGHAPVMDDITLWREQVKFPDLDAVDWEAAWERDKADPKNTPEHFVYFESLSGPFERLHALMGFEDALVATMTEPEACTEFFEAMVDYKIELIRRLKKYYPIDLFELSDDYGYQQNTFLPPDLWAELFSAPLKRLKEFCESEGIVFQLHSDGMVKSLIPYWLDLGITHWASCQPINDLPQVLRDYGDRLTLWPGLEFLPYEGKELTEEEQRKIMEEEVFPLCKGGVCVPDMWNGKFEAVFKKMLEEKADFYADPENCRLP